MTRAEAAVAAAPFTVRRGSRDAIRVPAALRGAPEQYQRACKAGPHANPRHQGRPA
ncbi:hypothetical protein CBM2589_A90099 [Cupriavidus taiwanensis]|uniref:Uncharacterized protein n=1 Tax=Cupriavidus taiwanensis TaxID=164546 RepID=A0A976A8U4_9BURK|nr:hypothetical protein CBM2589_A90099 [Cupriavidus taiwanensis]